MEIELVNKKLTTTGIKSCLSYPTGNLWPFQMVQGENAIRFTARDPTGRVWEFMLCTRNHGRYMKPVIRGEYWLDYVLGNPTGDVLIIAQGRVKHTETIFYVVRQIRLYPRESLYY
jgi:hypothetical protein